MAEGGQPVRGEESLLRLLPPIKRARDYRLYDLRGRRYLDLYLAGGRALLGHRPERVLLELKNLLSRGLASDLPSVFEHRLARALQRFLPDYPIVRVFANEERLISAFTRRGAETGRPGGTDNEGEGRFDAPVIGDPVVSGAKGCPSPMTPIQRWRPFLPAQPPVAGRPQVLVPVLPLPAGFAPAVACIRGMPESAVPPSDLVAPALLGALVTSVSELVRFEQSYQEVGWSRFEAPWWFRRGPYLVARCEKTEYSTIFRRLLENGILISPDYPGPSIVPGEFTDGELKPLKVIADEWGRFEGRQTQDSDEHT